MAEVVGLAASVIALLKVAIKLVNGLKSSIEEWQSRSKKVKELVKTLNIARGKLRKLVEKLTVLGGQGIANRNKEVVALTGSLRSADDEDSMRGATLGGIEAPDNTKVKFEMTVSGEMYFHLERKNLSAEVQAKEDPPCVRMEKPKDVELESTTLYLVFSPTPLVNEGGYGDYSVSLNLEQLREDDDRVKVKYFKFDIVN
ncbi:hypothetical protein R1flu_007705 [Riccia fluitans]|uniref:Uncharacterized protein n=1 Tax=Riccia fluitans TaxID=41844 RepID=A0ABD1YZM5_9MARC